MTKINATASTDGRRTFSTRVHYASLRHLTIILSRSLPRSTDPRLRTAMWRHKVTREPRPGREGSFLETFWCTTHAGFTASSRSQMGRRDIKTGCAYSSRRKKCGLHASPLFTLYSRLLLAARARVLAHLNPPASATSSSPTPRASRAVRARTYAPFPERSDLTKLVRESVDRLFLPNTR